MFNMEKFIEENLTEGYLNRAFLKTKSKSLP